MAPSPAWPLLVCSNLSSKRTASEVVRWGKLAERGGKSVAIAYTLIETAKLNGVDPQACLTNVLGRIADHKITKLDELMPWRYAQTWA